MALVLPDKPAPFPKEVRDVCIAQATARDKDAVADSALQLFATSLRMQILNEIHDAIETQELISGDRDGEGWDADLDAAVADRLAGVRDRIGEEAYAEKAIGVRLDIVGEQAAAELAVLVAESYAKGGKGKFLSAIGIVASDWEKEPSSAPPPPPADVLPPPPGAVLPPPPLAAPSIPASMAAAVAALPAGADPIILAFSLLKSGLTYDDVMISQQLGYSRTTFNNYLNAKTKAKCTPDQARVLLALCDIQAGKLKEAANLFATVV